MTTVSLTKIATPEQEAAQAVTRGIAWLDANLDWDWRTQVRANLDWLDLSSSCSCVLGILFHTFTEAFIVFPELDAGEGDYMASKLGFDTTYSVRYSVLTEAWIEALS